MSYHTWLMLEAYPVSWRSKEGVKDGWETIYLCPYCCVRSITRTSRRGLDYATFYMKDGQFSEKNYNLSLFCEGEAVSFGPPGEPYIFSIRNDWDGALDYHDWKPGKLIKIFLHSEEAFKRIDTCRLCCAKRKGILEMYRGKLVRTTKGFLKDGRCYSADKTPHCLVPKHLVANWHKNAVHNE